MMENVNLADWFSGIGSILAVLCAVGFWLAEQRSQRRSELRRISAWAERETPSKWLIKISNRTESPILTWRMTLLYDDKNTEMFSHEDLGIIPPGLHAYSWIPEPLPSAESKVLLSIEFYDVDGNPWLRTSTGSVKSCEAFK